MMSFLKLSRTRNISFWKSDGLMFLHLVDAKRIIKLSSYFANRTCRTKSTCGSDTKGSLQLVKMPCSWKCILFHEFFRDIHLQCVREFDP
mmetsp:Transcript_6833/g.14027  ORF Transcript_6833/g.14027 Transcript_6833/m.14027 type:complete len:90 (-) Transcript_6833:837-1106(-)